MERARTCSLEEINALIHAPTHDVRQAVLLALLENPQLQTSHLRLLLDRRELSAAILQRIAARKEWVRDAGIRRSLVAHLHTPHPLATKLARDLEVMDLVAISLRPSVPAEVRRFADELLLAHIPQLPLGQKLSLARRGPGRIAAELLAGGDQRIASAALNNAYLTEAQLLRALASEKLLAGAIAAAAGHAKWSRLPTVRAAVVRHPSAPLEKILSLLPNLPQSELARLSEAPNLRASLRRAIHAESEARARQATAS